MVLVGFGLLERRLTTLTNHDESRQEDCFERNDQRERLPWALFEDNHPHGEEERWRYTKLIDPANAVILSAIAELSIPWQPPPVQNSDSAYPPARGAPDVEVAVRTGGRRSGYYRERERPKPSIVIMRR
jgi:hypothetical protein